MVGNALSNSTYAQYSHGVVGCDDIRSCHDAADAQLCSALRMGVALDKPYQRIHPAIMLDKGEDTACEHGDEYQLAHTVDAIYHAVDPSHKGKRAIQQAYQSNQHIGYQQDN